MIISLTARFLSEEYTIFIDTRILNKNHLIKAVSKFRFYESRYNVNELLVKLVNEMDMPIGADGWNRCMPIEEAQGYVGLQGQIIYPFIL